MSVAAAYPIPTTVTAARTAPTGLTPARTTRLDRPTVSGQNAHAMRPLTHEGASK
jgi:hypothetical protein